MCHFVTTIHTYEGCKLLEKNDIPDEDLSPSTAAPTPISTPVMHMARLLRAIAKNASSSNGANGTSSTVAPDPEPGPELKLGMHAVKKKTYLQCLNARANKDLADSPDERYCPNASRWETVDEDQLVEPDNTVPTQLRGQCRVCRAAEEAANRAMDWIEVRPALDAITTTTTSPALAPTSSNLHPTRSNRRSNNAQDTIHIHHGRSNHRGEERRDLPHNHRSRNRRNNRQADCICM